jgi:multicomponent Na+:H+ antiporter subunit C
MALLELGQYGFVIVLLMIGLYVLIARDNLVKKMMGLGIFQTAIILLYISMAKVRGGTAPILIEGGGDVVYSNPLPHVLMLTAIVVAVATTGLGLAIIVRIFESYGTIEESELRELDRSPDKADRGAR